MYKKIYQKKFADSATATAHLDAAGWVYRGRKGFFRKYHLFQGVSVRWDGEVDEEYLVRLYGDGYVELFSEYNRRHTLSVSGLPQRVWNGKEAFADAAHQLNEFNSRLANELGNHFVMIEDNLGTVAVHRLVRTHPDALGKTKIDPPVARFETRAKAFEWSAAESKHH